jgi:two-component system CheB/CheR fusion protein
MERTLRPLEQRLSQYSAKQNFPVVGIGASEGGWEALCALVECLAPGSGMGLVFLHAGHKTEACPSSVIEVNAAIRVEPDHIYVVPSGGAFSLREGILHVEPDADATFPIDRFFRSLAHEAGSNAIGVLLSGEGSDGALGLQAIRFAGGIAFAQEPSSARCDAMLHHAVNSGCVDMALPLNEIAQRLSQIGRHPFARVKPAGETGDNSPSNYVFGQYFDLLQRQTGIDFSYYRRTLVGERVCRRMLLLDIDQRGHYLDYMVQHPAEVSALAGDLLIRPKPFFGPRRVFEGLATEVFPRLLANRPSDDTIRVWVPGCATGEQGYSIAICLAELQERLGTSVPFQIFCTDLSEDAIRKAHAGVFTAAALAEAPVERTSRFFSQLHGRYSIVKSIRNSCLFAEHDPVIDAPFQGIDLIFCYDVLSLLEPFWQKKALLAFHSALKEDGILLFGPSDRMSSYHGLFRQIDERLELYVKAEIYPADPTEIAGDPIGLDRARPIHAERLGEQLLVSQYAPPSVIVDQSANIICAIGATGNCLEMPAAKPFGPLLAVARKDLVEGLKRVLSEANAKGMAVTDTVRISRRGVPRNINLRVVPLRDGGNAEKPLILVIFEDAKPGLTAIATDREKNPATWKDREISRLEKEVLDNRLFMDLLLKQQEETGKDLETALQEVLVSHRNLERSAERLASANEELNTVNYQLTERNAELIQVNTDLANILASIEIALVMVERDLNIRQFTKGTEIMFNFIDSDIGRPITDLKAKIDVPRLRDLLHAAINGQNPEPKEVKAPNGRWYSLRVLPYRDEDQKIAGAVLALVDIDGVKRARDYAEAIVQSVRQPLVVLSGNMQVKTANPAFYQTFRLSKHAVENRSLFDLEGGKWNKPAVRRAIANALREKNGVDTCEFEFEIDDRGRRTLQLSAGWLEELSAGGDANILLSIEDITERKEAERRRLTLLKSTLATESEKMLRQKEAELARISRALTVSELAASISHEVNQPISGVVTNAGAALRWLSMDPPDLGNTRQSLGLIIRDANRASSVIRRIRDFLKNEQPMTAPVDIRMVIEEAITMVQLELVNRHIDVHFEPAVDLPRVRGDRVQLQQVLMNLLMNSCEAMAEVEDRARELVVSAEMQDSAVLVKVRDNGAGIGKEDLERMYDALFTTKPSGMGLGLSISRSIVEAHGGHIWTEEHDGPGVTVQFSVPVDPPPTELAGPAS